MSSQLAVGFDLDMTLIDTVPGFAATLLAPGGRARGRVPGRRPDRAARAAAGADAGAAPARRRGSRRPATGSGSSTPTTRSRPSRRCPARTRRWPPCAAQRGRIVLVTGKYRRNAQRHVDHLGLDVDVVEGWVWGVGKADVLVREGVSDLRRRPRPRRRGRAGRRRAQRQRADRRLHPRGAGAGRHRRRARGPRGVPGAGSTSTCSTTRLDGARARPQGARPCAGRLQRRRRQRVPARRGRPRARARPGRRRHRLQPLVAAGRARPGPRLRRPASAWSCSRPQTHEMEREGYRANGGDRCFFCKAELIEVLTPLAQARGDRHRRHRHQRRRRRGRLPARHPRRRRAGRGRRRSATPG